MVLDKDGRLSGRNRYGTASSNNAGEIPCWGIWVVFSYYFWAKKYDFLRLIADSERKLIP